MKFFKLGVCNIKMAISRSTMFLTFLSFFISREVFCQGRLPGTDESSKLEAAGTLLRILDTALFTWGARVFAGVCILSAGWALKEQRYPIAFLCVLASIVIGTVPLWVKNIFAIGGGSVFG